MTTISSFHGIEERIKRSSDGIQALIVAKTGPRVKEIIKLAEHAHIPIQYVNEDAIRKYEQDNKGVLLLVDESETHSQVDFYSWIHTVEEKPYLVVVLDHIEDPHNFGAILRSADIFAVDLVVVPNKRNVKATDTVFKVSAGAASYVPVAEVANIRDALLRLKEAGFWIYGADMEGAPLIKTQFAQRTALVMGSEGTGLAPLIKKSCDELISIPQFGHIDSLNVSVATGIMLYEIACRHIHKE